jgi:ketopantoate hydroxymethyltransferase
MSDTKISVETLKAMKARGEKIAALTAYDYPMAKLLDEAGIPMLLVGDSVGMVVLGYPDTTHVTMADIIPAPPAAPSPRLCSAPIYHSKVMRPSKPLSPTPGA